MRNSKKVLSKSQLAGALGVSRGRISQLIAVGLPVRADSKIDLDEAAAWYRTNVKRSSARSEGEAMSTRYISALNDIGLVPQFV